VLNFHEYTSEGPNEEFTVATWNWGNFRALLQDRGKQIRLCRFGRFEGLATSEIANTSTYSHTTMFGSSV